MDPLDEVLHYDTEHRSTLLRRAALLARGRADTIREHRETIRLLTIILALEPFTAWCSAPPGTLGIPIAPGSRPSEPRIPRQRIGSPAGVPGSSRPRRAR